MGKKIFTAEAVVVPHDLAETFDKGTGNKEGYLRDTIADKGNLHQLNEELLAIGLMTSVKGLMEDKKLPDDTKALSMDRLSHVIYVIMFAYCAGTMRVQEGGEVTFGDKIEDVLIAMELTTSKQIKFPSGKVMDTDEFMETLKHSASEKSIGEVYDKVVQRHGLTKSIAPHDAFSLAKVTLLVCNKIMEK